MKVGIFDSGVGGITVLKEALDQLPNLEYIYYSDNLNVPYGTKTKEEVLGYVQNVMTFLIEQGVESVIIACNTATSIAVEHLRKQYDIAIIGMEPAVKLAIDHAKEGRILVTATPLTLKEEKFRCLVKRIDDKNRVDSLALPELVTYAERFEFDEQLITEYFKEKLADYDLSQYSGIVLGCTHFIYFKKILKKLLPAHIEIFDGNEGTINHLKVIVADQLSHSLQNDEGQVRFYYSAKEDVSHEVLNRYLGQLK